MSDETLIDTAKLARLRAINAELAGTLGAFLDDPRFQVTVGGNPNAVGAMLQQARAALAKWRNQK